MPMRRRSMRPFLPLLILASWLAAPAPAMAVDKRVVVQGRVLSEAGEGLAGWPVQLIATQRYVEFSKYSTGGNVLVAANVTTDPQGYFSIDVPRQRGYQFWFVRFNDPQQLDVIQYEAPADVEITGEVRRGRVATVDKTIRQHPDWPEVQRRIAEAGGESTPRGKILRALGLPEKITHGELSSDEEWWYFTKGIVYTFRGAEAIGSRRFEPVTEPGGGDG